MTTRRTSILPSPPPSGLTFTNACLLFQSAVMLFTRFSLFSPISLISLTVRFCFDSDATGACSCFSLLRCFSLVSQAHLKPQKIGPVRGQRPPARRGIGGHVQRPYLDRTGQPPGLQTLELSSGQFARILTLRIFSCCRALGFSFNIRVCPGD